MKFFAKFALTCAFSLLGIAQAKPNPWQARYQLTPDQFQTLFVSLAEQGYRLNYVSGYTIGDEPRYAGIWEKKPSPEWVARIDLNSTQYQNAFDLYVKAKYRLVLVNGYTVKGEDRYVAIWDKSPSLPWFARHGMTSDNYHEQFKSSAQDGYQLRHVSGYAIGLQVLMFCRVITAQTNTQTLWIARDGLSSAEFRTQFDRLVGEGYRLTDISGYGIGNTDFYAGIWDKESGPAWVASIGLTPASFSAEFAKYVALDYILKVLIGYTVAGQDRYATLWEQA